MCRVDVVVGLAVWRWLSAVVIASIGLFWNLEEKEEYGEYF